MDVVGIESGMRCSPWGCREKNKAGGNHGCFFAWYGVESGGYMTDKELRRLSRAELLEMLLAQMEENEQLKQKLEIAEKALADRKIAIDQAGTLAEAALKLNGVFDAADRAVRQYLENIQRMTRERGGKQ